MRTKLRNMLGLWGEAGLLVYLTLVNGEEIEGLVKEVDGDELVLEPMNEDGDVGSITVVQLQHVVTATYIEPDTSGEAAIERENPYLDEDERVDPDQAPLTRPAGLSDDEFIASPGEVRDTSPSPTASAGAPAATAVAPGATRVDDELDADPGLEADGG